MKIGIVAVIAESGRVDPLETGDMAKCKARFRKVVADKLVVGSGKNKKQYVKVILDDLNRNPLKTRKC